MILEILLFIIAFVPAYYLYLYKKIHWTFDQHGIKYLPGIPVFGNIFNIVFQKEHLFYCIDKLYRAFPDEKYVGFVERTQPVLLIRDPEIIKNIVLKDFEHFVDHKIFFHEYTEPMLGDSVIQMKGKRWRDMRSTLSPAFTSTKLRLLFPVMLDICKNVLDDLKGRTGENVDIGDLVHRYTNDVIASTSFGVQVNSAKEKNNELFVMGGDLLDFNIRQRIIIFFMMQLTNVFKALNITVYPKKTMDFFRNIVKSTIEYRHKNNVTRPDMLQLLMEASHGWTEDEVLSQVFLFYAGGRHTNAGALTLAIHELALYPECEEKLYQECKALKDNGKTLTFETINELKYLDCVVNEVFRKWTIAVNLDRICTKSYELPPPREDGKPFVIKPGDMVLSVVNSIHMDEKYFPNPNAFDPERFSDENKHKIQPFTFMPFGIGPRNCMAARSVHITLKIFLYNLIINYKILKGTKTLDPIYLTPHEFFMKVEGGTFVNLEARN